MEEQQENPDASILRLLAFIAFFSTIPLYSPNVVPFNDIAVRDGLVKAFVEPMMAGAIFASAFLFVATLKATWSKAESMLRATSAFTCVAYAASMLAFYLSAAGILPFVPLAVGFAGALAGAGVIPLFVLWVKTFSGDGLRRLLLTLCLTTGTTAVVSWLFTYLPAMPLVAVCALLVVAGSTWPLVSRALDQGCMQETKASEFDGTAAGPPRSDGAAAEIFASGGFDGAPAAPESVEPSKAPVAAALDSKGMMRRFASVLLPAIIGLSMFAYFMGVSHAMIFGAISAESAGGVLGAVVVAAFCLRPSETPLLHTLYQVLLPIASLATIVLFTLPASWPFVPEAYSVVTYTFFCIAALLALGLGLAGANAGEFPAPLVVSGLALAFALASAAGLASGSASAPSETWFIPSFVVAAYAAYLIVPPVIGNARRIDVRALANELQPFDGASTEESDGSEGDSAERSGDLDASKEERPQVAMSEMFFKQRAEEIGDEFGLSPREREIIGYIGRGHSSVYIAKTLVISENTVYTHVRNIYRKTSVNTREELLKMFIPA